MVFVNQITETASQTEINGKTIREDCRRFGIKHLADAMWMEEFSWEGRRFDLLTLDLRTWIIRGFEVKVTRADFIGDDKWKDYLPFVNYFYFATPPGLIHPKELPSDIGLIEKWPEKIVTKKRAGWLQPNFARHTYGELLLTKIMIGLLRALSWRETRIWVSCDKCGETMKVRDGRHAGIGKPI